MRDIFRRLNAASSRQEVDPRWLACERGHPQRTIIQPLEAVPYRRE
jgi:hypothetical protein